ncbi:DUF4270 domain-containing protein [Pedobacter hiemivivus]|uniref:DUF4270 domain-containing protein n=1 Tax=Pedobacter hiemivivus TaxID=2530454 RepID=A0A4R0MIX6_9SPHI|nr:DUF4270 domain-containing protein [Pedobacter hiemivivus]TCC86559.1 DUF4270 domain-containing protein [Pedobacter hiemivivus]
MKFTKQDLLTMLIGLFLFASCKDSNTIGLDLDDASQIKGDLMDTTTVTSQTLRDDVTSGVSLARYPFGFMTDGVFGTSSASIAMAVALPNADYSTYKFGTNPVIDSAVLVLPYTSQVYGDTTTSVYTVNVEQLSLDLSKEKTYQSDKNWPVDATVGTFSGKIRPTTKTSITTVVKGGPDTLVKVVPQMRIKLTNAFIQTNILDKDSLTLSKPNNFFKSFKGLKVSATASNKGGIMFFNFAGTDGKLEIYYKKQNATTPTAKDTVAVSFPIGAGLGPVTATVNHGYTQVILDQLGTNPPATDVTYLQALAGLKNKISFPYLKNFIADLKKPANGGSPNTKVIVNKAELVIDLNSNTTDVVPFGAAQRLALYRFDIAGQRVNVPDNDNGIQNVYAGDPRALGEALFGGYFDSVRNRYIFTITAYIQDLLDGKTQDYGTFLAPSSLTEFNLSPSVTSAARSIINKHKKNPASGLKLNIFYTQIN